MFSGFLAESLFDEARVMPFLFTLLFDLRMRNAKDKLHHNSS